MGSTKGPLEPPYTALTHGELLAECRRLSKMLTNQRGQRTYGISGAALENYTKLMNAVHDLIVTFDNAHSHHIDVVNRIDVLRVMLAQARQIRKEAQIDNPTQRPSI
jgi:hypothetical protein